MEENENKKRVSIIVDDEVSPDIADKEASTKEKLKKRIIFVLMGLVFLGCLYLIFKPKPEEKTEGSGGLKNAVPEATDKGLQADKQKAYEQDLMDQREADKRSSLSSLSDYWNSNDTSDGQEIAGSSGGSATTTAQAGASGPAYQNKSLMSYQNAQQTLGAFYRDDDREKLELRKKVDQLQERLSEKDVPAPATINDQLKLMEESYKMASKYLPTATQGAIASQTSPMTDSMAGKKQQILSEKKNLASVVKRKKEIVTSLDREGDDKSLSSGRNYSFINAGIVREPQVLKNSISASIMETQTINNDGSVKLRLQETAIMGGQSVSEGTTLVAAAKFSGNRLQLKISSVEVNGNIVPVEILVYDVDGQLGLSIPRSDEISAVSEIAANMSQSSGMNISMSGSAGQQVASDLSRGLIQGVSGYFSRKLRTPKVAVKAGHQVLLVAKK